MPILLGIEDGSTEVLDGLKQEGQTAELASDKSHRRTYIVLADNCGQNSDTILATSGIPALRAAVQGMYVDRRTPKEAATVIHPVTGVLTILWHIDIEATNQWPATSGQEPDPLDWTPVIRWKTWRYERRVARDVITGDPIVTRAFEPIEASYEAILPLLEIERYEAYPFDPGVILDYCGHLNTSTFWGAAENNALIDEISVEEERIEGVKLCKVTYAIKFFGEFIFKPLHQGFRYKRLIGAGPAWEIVNATDVNGNPLRINLDEDGFPLANDDPPVYLEFNTYPKTNFAPLGINNTDIYP